MSPKVTRIIFVTKGLVFMTFSSISIDLLEFSRFISQSKLNQFYHVGGVLESSGQADFKTVPGFAFRAIFDGCIEGFTLLKVLLATTVLT